MIRTQANPKGWKGLRLPSAPAVAGEDLVAGARRAVEKQLGIDVADQTAQIAPLKDAPELTLYRASGGYSTVVFMRALEPPPEGAPLEDYDLSCDPRACRVDAAATTWIVRGGSEQRRSADDPGIAWPD